MMDANAHSGAEDASIGELDDEDDDLNDFNALKQKNGAKTGETRQDRYFLPGAGCHDRPVCDLTENSGA